MLISNRKSTGLKYLNDPKGFIEHSNDMVDIYKNIEEYNPNKKQKVLIVFDDIMAGILSNKKRNTMVTELLIRGRKLNISLIFMTQSYFALPKKYEAKFNTLFCYENSRQKRTSTNSV